MASFPARLHVLMAARSRVAVIIRRGPSKQVATILWNRRKDTFEVGQWLKGRIYERRSDLSPDGNYLLIFAMNGHWDSEVGGSWTAISKAPYLKAITLLGKGDCWNGGGLWTASNRYWLNDGYGHKVVRNSGAVARDKAWQPEGGVGGECLGVYYPRLLRDGWTMGPGTNPEKHHHVRRFDKALRRGWVLQKFAHAELNSDEGHGCYWDEHVLENHKRGVRFEHPEWEWAELDGNRLVWAAKGCLFAARMGKDGPLEPVELANFNDMRFEPLTAPY